MATHKDNKTKSFKSSKEADVDLNKGVAALSYVWILCLVPLFLKRDSEFAQFHAKQGLLLFGLSLVCWFPFFGWILGLVVFIISVLGVIKTLNGEWWEIPYIHNWSKKINL